MKNIFMILCLVALATTGRLSAQGSDVANQEKMKVFALWTGKWHGEGTMHTGGEMKTITVDKNIELKLDGRVLVMEGVGKSKDEYTQEEVVVHHAFGILSYDETSHEYKLRTYLTNGRTADVSLKVLDGERFQWYFDSPPGKVRYTINVDRTKSTWKETGEYSADGTVWRKFFDVNLVKAG